MPKADYIQTNDDAFNAQLQTFNNNIDDYAAVLGVTPAQISSVGNDTNSFGSILQSQQAMSNAAQQWTAWKLLMRNGGTAPAGGAPVLPTLPALTTVAPGIEARFRALVQLIKANPNYNVAIGQALGIEGAQHTGPDLATVQPVIAAVISGNHVNVKWGWGGNHAYLDICELQVDRGDGHGFVLLAFDTTPNYTDTQPFPAAPTKWTYRAIYRVGDSQVGLWSLSVSVTVGA